MVKLSDIELPVVFKNQLLFKPGKHNPITNKGFNFNEEMVKNSVKNTKWSALNKRLYLKHDGAYDVSKWKGKVENIKPVGEEVRGDVEIWDAEEGMQILYGGKPIALSADIEHNENDIMYFTGFALENTPGINDVQMYLSDSVKNELNGMYHASFSAELDTANIVNKETQVNPLDNQSAERGLIDKQTDNMTENKENTINKELVDKLVKDIGEVKGPVTEPSKEEVKTEPIKEETKVEPVIEPVVKQEGTVADKPLSVVSPQENVSDKMIDTIVNRLAEKLKADLPKPVTINEFGGNQVVDSEEETVNKLAESLAKI